MLILVLSLPISVFAAEIAAANEDPKPIIKVESKYKYDSTNINEFRALPDSYGTFYFDISVDMKNGPAPAAGEEILVYYRTVDDSAVAKWGDYEAVGVYAETYVSLNSANGYTARVTVNSTVLDFGSVYGTTDDEIAGRLITRRFIFGLTRVEGKADLAADVEGYTAGKSELYCYLRASTYISQSTRGDYHSSEYPLLEMNESLINTSYIFGTGSQSGTINFQVPDYMKELLATGNYDLGISVLGQCQEKDGWNNDGPTTFDLYYTYQGEQRQALSLIVEGEFDDSTFYGWEHAYDYAYPDYEDWAENFSFSRKHRDEFWLDYFNNDHYTRDHYYDIDDFIEDNFYGFRVYGNDGKVAYEVTKDKSRDVSKLVSALKECKIAGNVVQCARSISYDHPILDTLYGDTLYYLRLPSNFAYADSYSWTFSTDGESDEARALKDLKIIVRIIEKNDLEIAEDEDGNQMVTTNIDSIREGDKLKLTVRFNQLATMDEYYGSCKITAKINGTHTVTFKLVQPRYTKYSYSNAWDTFVFEADLPPELEGVSIKYIRDITLDVSDTRENFRAFLTKQPLLDSRIDDIYGIERDLRTPVATVNVKNTENWLMSKALDIYVNTAENLNSRFNDFVTVYYQWNNDPKNPPKTYSSQVTLYTYDDGQIFKTIIGSGNGAMYLHLKAVSRYGKTSISDSVTGVYDPTDENAVYTPFGIYKFDNSAPTISITDDNLSSIGDVTITTGAAKEHTVTFNKKPDDRPVNFADANDKGAGLREVILYRVGEDDEVIEVKKFTEEDFTRGLPSYTISHRDVGIGVDEEGKVVFDRGEVTFYWVLIDRLGNSSGKTAEFTLIFDTNNYLENEISSVGPYDVSSGSNDAQFENTTSTVDDVTFIYDYSYNSDKTFTKYGDTEKTVYYAFAFAIADDAFGGTDGGTYTADVYFGTEKLGDEAYSVVKTDDGVCLVLIHAPIDSGRYDIRLVRTEGDSTRVSVTYTVYATDSESDDTEVKGKIEFGTLLKNVVYQLSSQYPYFYYKDGAGAVHQEYYNGVRQPATFSSYSKAKDYVYYKELGDIYLVQLNAATANALSSGTTGYLIAKGETVTPQAGQYWIRYKSEAWTPTSGESAWVYYYYGMSGELSEGSFSANLQIALNTVANRIVSYGKTVTLTDSSLFLGSPSGDKMLDENGMPYLLDAQIHSVDEFSDKTKCQNEWSIHVYYVGDRSIYNSIVSVGEEGSAGYEEFPIIGDFNLPQTSRFQYMTYEGYSNNSGWQAMELSKGQTFFDYFTSSGVYYVREMSNEGVSIYSFYVDKEAPEITLSKTDDSGKLVTVPVDRVEVLDIRTKDLYIGKIGSSEYDRLSYVAVYKVSNLSLVGIYSASDLDSSSVKLEDGNYYLVISDRSGNHYTVTAKVSSSDLECPIKESENKFIKLSCNRRSDQIVRYEVYLNGQLVTSTYAPEQTFDKAGVYSIYIQDIYGNVFAEDDYTFTRDYPKVDWKYLGEDGKYHVGVENAPSTDGSGFVLNWIYDNQYKISTAVKTRFSFSDNYDFEFVGTVPRYTKSIGTETVVTIEEGQSYTLKVYYKNHKDCYSIYSCVVDVTPPTITVSADVDKVTNGENELFDKWASGGKVGDVITMEEIYYTLSDITHKVVSEGETITSDVIQINANDANDLSLVEIYLDGELIKRQDSGFSQIVVNRWGSYRIVAKDTLGNVSEFNFVNGITEDLDYYIDGVERELELHGYLNFEKQKGKYVYTKVDCGQSEFKLDISSTAYVFMSVGLADGNSVIYGFKISDGQIYALSYKIALSKNGKNTIEISSDAALINTTSPEFKVNTDYLISKNGSYDIYASIGADNTVSIKVYAPKDSSKIALVSARVELAGSDTFFVSTELSKKSSNVTFKDLKGNEIVGVTSTDIRANAGFSIDETAFLNERIDTVKLYYSKLNDLDPTNLKDRKDVYISGKQYTDEGFYLLVIRNRFDIETVYKISISRSFGVTSSVTFKDGHKVYYSKDYKDTLYSNGEITLDVLDESITYKVIRNGSEYTSFVKKSEAGITYLVFSEGGSYRVELTDAYKNSITRELVIDKTTYTVADELLTGYNEKALKRDEGYTNQMLSVNKKVVDSDGIYYLSVQYGETLTVLFDAFSETPISTDEKDLINVIGSQGDGIYKVVCRNRYGAVVTKDINYRSTPTLKLERTTRSNLEKELYELERAISIGFWSNNTLIFTTDAKTYEFRVNGNLTECPKTLVFDHVGDFGSFEYDITYVDEYGFEYSFKAYIVRKNVTIDVPTGVTGIEVNGILNTKNDISLILEDNVYATYRLNNGEEVAYNSGDVLRKDGTYRFTVIDYAGNASTLAIRRDTVVDFSFVDENSGNSLTSGSVVNSSKVELHILNKDSVQIQKVLKDGVLQAEFTGSKFSEDGKWEVLLSDELGNEAYFSFYVMTRSKKEFAYTTPYEYRIAELWYDSGDGVKISYVHFVDNSDSTSSFSFKENGKYTVVMSSDVTGITSSFSFTINNNAPTVSLVGCNNGETTINDVSITGCKVGDTIKIYLSDDGDETLVEEIAVTSSATKMPTLTEGGKYRVVVESEAGVQTELNFVRKHVMNTTGSIFIMIVIGVAVVGLFAGLIYRNKSKTDD